MDRAGYKAYLQSLGNQKYYIGLIQELFDLEQELNIDLDDYIPYDEDYSKGSDLDAILLAADKRDIRLYLSINSYMRYRLSGYKKNEEIFDKEKMAPVCSEFFSFNGTRCELEEKLKTFMSEEDSRSFIDGLQAYLPFLGESEIIEVTPSFPKRRSEEDDDKQYLLLQSSHYNINLKALTLTALALLLDIKLTMGFASSVLAILGFNSQAIVRLDVSEGETCLILEAIQSKHHVIDENVFSLCNSECVHNDLDCKYQNDDKCTIERDGIRDILDKLCAKNIFRKINNSYKYNF